ncbi:ferrochelatase [Fictibacillus gelatini]|uniref:ferrochelatase n=1 Tax=Fictibacillus gelatini TaxID=225985 RepID=UPI000427F297|nr:ferrochelatase [Fictibacillus gelatini]
MKRKLGLLVMAYGTPNSMDEVESYYTHIRHGRKPPEELLDDLKRRYKAIGGISPLTKITRSQAKQLELKLNSWFEDIQFVSYLGFKHASPFIEDAVKQMKDDGIEEAISIILAPHYSIYSLKAYNDRVKIFTEKINGPIIYPIDSWYDEPKFISFWAKQIKKTMVSVEDLSKVVVIFSAHSLPEKIILNKDPYPEQLIRTAEMIAQKANVKHYAVGWQSAGNTGEAWLGPDVQDLTRQLYERNGYTSFIYCPVGFVADHLEVLYDNDFECKAVTEELGVRYYRPKMPNTNPIFIEGLASVVAKKARTLENEKVILIHS